MHRSRLRTLLLLSFAWLFSTVLVFAQSKGRPKHKKYVRAEKDVSQVQVLSEFGKEIDKLKAEVDEWGAISFSAIVFAPPQFNSVSPFALEESNPKTLTFDKLYGDYNASQGQSLFSQRTQTRTYGAAAVNVDRLGQQVEEAKQKLFQTNLQRVVSADAAKTAQTEKLLGDAGREYQAAVAADALAQKKLITATQGQAEALAKHTAATKAVAIQEAQDPQDKAAILNAQLALIDAEQEKATAESLLMAAQSEKQRTAAAASSAKTAFTTAETNHFDSVNAPIGLPSNAPTTSSLGNPLDGITTDGTKPFGNIPSASDNLATLGSNALPDLVGGADPASSTGSFSPLARINSAAAALTVKNIHSFLGDPEAALSFEDKKILFGVSSLSINPGWRTKRDFKGIINGRVRTELVSAHSATIQAILRNSRYPVGFRKRIADTYPSAMTQLQRQFYRHVKPMTLEKCQKYTSVPAPAPGPTDNILVSAVTPMVDSQNLDLASSIARQDEVALYLAAAMAKAGATGAARAFTSWTRQRRRDVATRSTLATANSLTHGGGYVSFEIGTSLRGLDSSLLKGNKAAHTLDRQTFPILLMFGMAEDDVLPKFSMNRGKIFVKEPQLTFAYSTHWARTSKKPLRALFVKDRKPSDTFREVLELGEKKKQLNIDLTRARQSESDRQIEQGVWWEKLKDIQYRRMDPYSFERWEGQMLELGGVAAKTTALQKAIEATKDNMDRDYRVFVRDLHGANSTYSFPVKWMLNSNETDSSLNDPNAKVEASTMTFDPESLVFKSVGQTANIVLRGANLRLIDPARIKVFGGSLKNLSAISLDDQSISLTVEAVEKNGKVRFILPHKNGNDAISTEEFNFSVSSNDRPTVNPWLEKQHSVSGLFGNGAWSGRLNLPLLGTNLHEINPAAVLRGVGFDSTSKVMIRKGNEAVAIAIIDLQSKTGQGEASIELSFGNESKPLITDSFKFAFQNTLLPSVQAWGMEEYLVSGTEAKGKWSGSRTLVLQGDNFSRLGKPELKGITGKVEFERSGEKVGVLKVTITDSPQQGQAFVVFPVTNDVNNAKVFSEPFKYRMVK